jgi:hypothetical protein
MLTAPSLQHGVFRPSAQMLRKSMMGQPIFSFNFDEGNPATLTEFKNSCV